MKKNKFNSYSVAFKALSTIASHPKKVSEGMIGYFLKINNIKDYTSFDPNDWYLNKKESFKMLSKKDQDEILALLSGEKSNEEKDIKRFCEKCYQVSLGIEIKLMPNVTSKS